MIKGRTITWEDIKCFDDIISDEEREMIRDLEGRNGGNMCPHLRKIESYFRYCGKDIPESTKAELKQSNPIFASHRGVIELQLLCMEDYKKCCFYTGEFSSVGSIFSSKKRNRSF